MDARAGAQTDGDILQGLQVKLGYNEVHGKLVSWLERFALKKDSNCVVLNCDADFIALLDPVRSELSGLKKDIVNLAVQCKKRVNLPASWYRVLNELRRFADDIMFAIKATQDSLVGKHLNASQTSQATKNLLEGGHFFSSFI